MKYLKPQHIFQNMKGKLLTKVAFVQLTKTIFLKKNDFQKGLEYEKRGKPVMLLKFEENIVHYFKKFTAFLWNTESFCYQSCCAWDHFRQKPTSSGRARRSHRT